MNNEYLVNSLQTTIVSLLWFEFVWNAYLNRKQFLKVMEMTELPKEIRKTMPPPIFQISREFALDMLNFNLARSVIIIIVSTLIINKGSMASLWNYAKNLNIYEPKSEYFETMTTCVWLCLLHFLSKSIHFPLDLYYAFILDRQTGIIFTFRTFLHEQLIEFIIIQIQTVAIALFAFYILLKIGKTLLFLIWFMMCFLLSSFVTLAPVFISPSRSKLARCGKRGLKSKLEHLSNQFDFPMNQIEVLLYSDSMDSHDCVFFYGTSTKNVVISVNILPLEHLTLNNTVNEEEIMALFAHQLGHWCNNHILKILVANQISLILWFIYFSYVSESEMVYQAFGFDEAPPLHVGVIITLQFLMVPFNLLLKQTLILLSRKFEYDADIFVANLGMSDALKRALSDLYVVNSRDFPVLDEMYSKYSFPVPSLYERIRYLNEFNK